MKLTAKSYKAERGGERYSLTTVSTEDGGHTSLTRIVSYQKPSQEGTGGSSIDHVLVAELDRFLANDADVERFFDETVAQAVAGEVEL